jgi:DNA-nicking Smr family endonuclease
MVYSAYKVPKTLLSDEDRRLWRQAMRDAKAFAPFSQVASEKTTTGAGKLAPAALPDQEPLKVEALKTQISPPPKVQLPPPLPKPSSFSSHGMVAGLDKKIVQRLRQGDVHIEEIIDLHGLSQVAAYHALEAFILKAERLDKRKLLIITGKGRPLALELGGKTPLVHSRPPLWQPGRSEQGVLARQVPLWLENAAFSCKILTYGPAHPKHGGGGALYVVLRRKRL